MVKLLVGHKGSGKTKSMIELANEQVEKCDGNVVFINKNNRLMYDLKHDIRVVCMEEYEEITNSDEYIGFLYGIISANHDIEVIFIDSILKHTNVNIEDVPEFIARLKLISEEYKIEFVVSISADLAEIGSCVKDFEVLN
ncbi:MAG: hypothetical protein RR131_06030 [Anaerovorax sp.]